MRQVPHSNTARAPAARSPLILEGVRRPKRASSNVHQLPSEVGGGQVVERFKYLVTCHTTEDGKMRPVQHHLYMLGLKIRSPCSVNVTNDLYVVEPRVVK